MISAGGGWLRAILLTAHLMILPLCVGNSDAGDEPAAAPASAPLPAASGVTESIKTDPAKKPNVIGKTVEITHDEFERNILEQVIRLDTFFGNIKTENQQKASYQLRWRNSLRVEEGGQVRYGTTLRANVKLSRINDRLHVVLFGEDEPEPFSSSLSEDPGNPGFDRGTQSMRVVNTELRYDIVRKPTLDIFLGTGVRFIIPPEAFLRRRFQYPLKTHRFSFTRL